MSIDGADSDNHKLHDMTATQTLTQLDHLVAGVRLAVGVQATPAETAQLVAARLRRHLPTPDVLSAEPARSGPPEGYQQPHAARGAGRLVLDRGGGVERPGPC